MVLEAIVTIVVELIKTPITDYVVSPVKRHLRYAFKCDSQVQNLQEAVVQLKNKKDRLEKSVAEATRSGEEIYENVTTWLNNVENGLDEAEQLIQGKDEAKKKCCSGACPNLKTRYQLSKKADKKASAISKLVREAEELNPISFQRPLEPIVEPSVYAQETLASRLQILDQIMEALKDLNLNMIGVYGMGGVGKTTLAKEVQAKAMQEKMFEKVILIAVSQTPELRKIQSEIADFLGLKFDAQELPGRASQLHMRLEKSKVLIILDDVWQKLDLNAIGIPSGDSCKLLLTSRKRDVLLVEMGAQKEFFLGILGEGEAWKLFQTIAPKSIDPLFHATATEVSKKCAGLPLLIIIVANELKKREFFEWVDMLNQLSALGNIDIHERVHKVLEKSFNKLPGEEVKSLFLLCSLFVQSNIQIQLLLLCSMGLGIFKHVVTIHDSRIRLRTLLNKLKADCLLLDGDKDGYVKMHDVVRDSAISIASRSQHAFVGAGQVSLRDLSRNSTKISLPYCDVHELPGDLECPLADLFLLFTENLCLEVPDSFFKGLRKLKVVHFTGMRLESLPSSIGLIPNLHTLSLQRCRLYSIAVIGELKQLQLLSLAESKFVELPSKIGELTQLKLLDLSNCSMLQVIPANVLSKWCSIEELYMLNSFDRWDLKDNASLMELEGLSHLSTLELQIVNPKLIPRGFRFFDGLQLDTFKIAIGEEWSWDGKYEKSKKIILKQESSVQLGQRIEGLLRGAEDLSLDGVWGINFDGDDFPQLKHLRIENDSGNIQHLIKFKGRASFQILESLYLRSLESLEKICDGQLATGSFGKLQKLNVTNCQKLKSLFSVSSAKCMSQLQELKLDSCYGVEAVVGDGADDGQYNNEVIEFTQLNSLVLYYLPELRCFCKKEEGSQQTKLLFNGMVSFPNLTSLVVYRCKNLNYIFTASMVKCLGQLKMLEIQHCESVEEIMVMGKSEEIEGSIVFFKLDSLKLSGLQNLRRFCCGHLIDFLSLKTLSIDGCPSMENFVSKISSNRNNGGSDGYFFNEPVTLANLEKINLTGLKSFKYLWDEKFIVGDSFCKLLSLTICRCSELQVIFPSNVYRRFQKLETLRVENCADVKEIYQCDRVDLEDNNIVPTFSLRDLHIWNMQSLKHIWSKDSSRDFSFRSLQSVSIDRCEDLEYVFPESIASDLVQLQKLSISECSVKIIISMSSEDRPSSFEFPELTTVQLLSLDNMKNICEGSHALELPKLKSLELYDCDDLLVQESMPFVEKFIPNLEELTIGDQGFNAIHHQNGVFPAELFSKLKKVTVRPKDEESIQYLSGFLKRLNSMEMLALIGFPFVSFDLESLFGDEKAVGEKEHHSRLKHLELRLLRGLKHIVKKESPLNSTLQHLQTLLVDWCDDLMDIALSSTSFQNLTTLKIYRCSKMTTLVTSSTAKTMVQLVHMQFYNCDAIEEIIATDANCTKHDVINFNKLKCLELQDLRKIDSFCSGHVTFNFPLLQEVKVHKCPKMKNFCCGALSTPKLQRIIFDDEQQWEGDLNATIAFQLRQWVGVRFGEWAFFQNVKSVESVKDACSSKVISANQMQFLHKLKRIIVEDCELVQVVFDLEGLCVEDGHATMLPKLDEIHLTNLPSLNKLCSNPPSVILEFNKLTKLEIENCGRLEYAFTWSMAACLVQLQTIELRNCELMERIIKGEEADGAATVTLGSLRRVVLECLPKFSSFYTGNGDLECPSLENINIKGCPSIQAFISSLPREEGIKVHNVHLCHKVLPCLKELSLDMKSVVAILKVKFPTNFFLDVKTLVLQYCSVKTAGSCVHLLHFLSSLPSLGKLEINTSSLEELFKFEQLNMLEEAVTLPQITSLKLENVADVKHIWWHNASLFQSLRTLVVSDCRDLFDLASSSSSFQNLTTLAVYGCTRLINLITSSIAKSMVQLEILRVDHCDVLKEIVGNENDGTSNIEFTKLKTLELSVLQSLQSFSSSNCAFHFPCLENIILYRCPNLRTFCAGTIRAPKLFDVEHHSFFERRCYWEGDINATIQKLYMKMVDFHYLEDVKLSTFPLLKEKWGDQIPFKYFHLLKKLVVNDITLISCAIPPHLLRQLKLVEELKVEKCEALEQVFNLEGLNPYGRGSKRLKELRLIDLPSLRNVWSKYPHPILSFRNLRLLEVQNCDRLTYIFDISMALRLPRLEHVEVKNCNLVEHIIVKAEEETMQECRTIFPSLQSISLQHLTSLSSFYSPTGLLECPSLKIIEVVECPNIKLLPSTFSSGQDSYMDAEDREQHISSKDPESTPTFFGNQIAVPVLDELKVEWNRLKPIFNDDNQPEFLSKLKLIELISLPSGYGSLPPNFLQFFPKLEKLSLSDSLIEEINLHEFRSLEGGNHGSLTLLTKLKFVKLPKLEYMVCDDSPRVAIFQNLEDLEVAECSRLKILVPPTVSFQNLTNLQVSNCDGMLNLITSSTSRSLVQLKKMEVKECKMMQEIVAVELHGGEHEIRFSQLECLELVNLPYLESFYSGKFDLNFPSLEKVVVIGCPNMKKFASSVTPKLKKVETGRHKYEWEWEGNLDNTIQAMHAEKEAEETEPRST